MEDLTRRQREVFEFLNEFQELSGFPPTIQEIRDHFRFASPQTVVDHLSALKRKGVIRIRPKVSRGIEILGREGVPILGQIAAGGPILAVENIMGHIPLNKAKEAMKADFALEIKGDSMILAGILDKDYVFIQKTTDVRVGEIVAALIEDEATVKRLMKNENGYYLQPENDDYENIYLDQDREEIQIIGRVTGVFRKY